MTNITDVNTTVMTLILKPSKLVDIPQKAYSWQNFCFAALLKIHFCVGNLL